MYVTYVSCTHAGQKRVLDSLEPEFQTVVSPHVDAGNQTSGPLKGQQVLLITESSLWS